jgi:cell division protein FtsQ
VTAPTGTRRPPAAATPAAPDAAAGIDPRMRARRIAVRRDEGRRRLHRLVALGAVAVLALAAVGSTRSPLLDVDHVEVAGAYHTLPDAILHAGGVRRGSAMTDVDVGAVRARVAALPWIGTVSVARRWPGTVRISVIERQAVASVAVGADRWALVDRTGRLLQVDPAPVAGFPELAGVDASGEPGDAVAASARDLVSVATQLPDTLVARVRAVGRDDSGLVLTLTTCGTVRLGTAAHLGAKLVAAETVLDEVPLDGPGQALAVLDVRVPTAPVLTHDPNCANVSTATGG